MLACVNCINIFIEVKYYGKTCISGGSVLNIYSVVTATFFCDLLLITRSCYRSSTAKNSFFHCTVVFLISVVSQKSWQLYVD